MTIIRGIGNLVRGTSFLVFLAVLFCCVLLASCLARFLCGEGFSEVARKLRPGA